MDESGFNDAINILKESKFIDKEKTQKMEKLILLFIRKNSMYI